MNNKAIIYVTSNNTREWNHFAKVYINGVKAPLASRAKSGKNGFVEVPKWDLDDQRMSRFVKSKGYIPTKKIRGNVKISFKQRGVE